MKLIIIFAIYSIFSVFGVLLHEKRVIEHPAWWSLYGSMTTLVALVTVALVAPYL